MARLSAVLWSHTHRVYCYTTELVTGHRHIHCAYVWRGGQAELACVDGHVPTQFTRTNAPLTASYVFYESTIYFIILLIYSFVHITVSQQHGI